MDHINNFVGFESYNPNESIDLSHQEFLQLPVNFNNEISSSVDPDNVPNYDHHVAEFFSPGGGCSTNHVANNTNKGNESEWLVNSSSSLSIDELVGSKKNYKNEDYNGKKRKRNYNQEVQKPKEVVHVRAKRGQATDSHSLAERLRREKINDKLKCLQGLVPGCYKTMGMSVMLDVIINYVRSLQNQIDFLSMKLSTASLYYDYNTPDNMDAMGAMQGTNNAYEANGMGRVLGDGYGGFPQFQTSWPL